MLGASHPSAWLIPLAVVVAAAIFAYLGGWAVKRQDVERTIAAEADVLLEEAQQLAADRDRWNEETLRRIKHLAQTAGMRARRLADADVDDRFNVCNLFLFDCLTALREGQRYWAEEAVSNVRLGLDAFTSPPSLWPWRVPAKRRQRIFPTKEEYTALMQYEDDQAPRVQLLAQWQTEHGVRQ
jgi:hypothetical protein